MGIIINEEFEKIRRQIKKTLNSKRYIHSLGVSYTAASLSMRYGYDISKAQIAGILHDCAKSLEPDELLRLSLDGGLDLSETEQSNPELLHAKCGSIIAYREYQIRDKEILDSIFYHTTGRPDMSLLEKIVFVADYIEPSRKNLPELDSIRETAFCDIDKAIVMICENSLSYIKNSGKLLDRKTLDTFTFYKKITEE